MVSDWNGFLISVLATCAGGYYQRSLFPDHLDLHRGSGCTRRSISGHFKAVQLSYVYFPVAAIIGGILALYIRIGRRTSLINLLAGTLSLCFINVVAFWWMAHLGETIWLFFARRIFAASVSSSVQFSDVNLCIRGL
jgi:hypothetical protein